MVDVRGAGVVARSSAVEGNAGGLAVGVLAVNNRRGEGGRGNISLTIDSAFICA